VKSSLLKSLNWEKSKKAGGCEITLEKIIRKNSFSKNAKERTM
jgi:hypothetical protein